MELNMKNLRSQIPDEYFKTPEEFFIDIDELEYLTPEEEERIRKLVHVIDNNLSVKPWTKEQISGNPDAYCQPIK